MELMEIKNVYKKKHKIITQFKKVEEHWNSKKKNIYIIYIDIDIYTCTYIHTHTYTHIHTHTYIYMYMYIYIYIYECHGRIIGDSQSSYQNQNY